MALAKTNKQKLQQTLLNYYHGDSDKVRLLAEDCKKIGFPLGENIDAIMKHNEAFQTLIVLSDFGTIRKLTEVLDILKEK